MRRRKNPWTTFVMFLGVCGMAWAAYHYLYVERIFQSAPPDAPAEGKTLAVKEAIERAFADDPCFQGVSSILWRDHEGLWRIDISLGDGCREEAKRIAAAVADVVRRASDGQRANVFCYILGAEVHHLIT